MKVYRISERNAAAESSAALKRTGFMTGAAVVVAVLLGAKNLLGENSLRVILVEAMLIAVFVAVVVWQSLARAKRRLADAYASFQITDDGLKLTKEQKNSRDVTLMRTEIKRIEEFQGKGFRICTNEQVRNIWVPCEVDDYEQLKAALLSLPGVELSHQSRSWLKTYVVLGAFLALFAVSLIATDKRIVCGTSLLLSAYLFFAFLRHYRNPNLTKRGQRQLLWAGFVGLCLVIRAIVVWRS